LNPHPLTGLDPKSSASACSAILADAYSAMSPKSLYSARRSCQVRANPQHFVVGWVLYGWTAQSMDILNFWGMERTIIMYFGRMISAGKL
jgi:hypothetical protein